MSHEMYENDSAAYFKKPAWHGLGNVVDTTMSTSDALDMAGLNWYVDKSPIEAFTGDGYKADGGDHRALVRRDTRQVLGVASKDYKVMQNHEAFSIADALGDVTVESAGSIRNGANVYLLLHDSDFAVDNDNDAIDKYLAMFWGHDGSLAFTAVPTSIRIVCKNTLDMAVGQAAGTKNKVTIKHSGDLDAKIAHAKQAMYKYKKASGKFEETVNTLAQSKVYNDKELARFFLETWSMLNKTAVNEENKHLATITINKWKDNFDQEANHLTPSWWLAANAVTKDIQHAVPARGRRRTPQSKAYSNLIGKNALESRKVMNKALTF